jgi:hypothetical protein
MGKAIDEGMEELKTEYKGADLGEPEDWTPVG